jgi:ribokinase
MKSARVAVVGSLNMDLVAAAPTLPTAGETVMGTRLLHVPGGKGANQAVAAARLGCEVTMIGRVGDDDFGRRLLGHLHDDGVDVSHVTVTSNATTGVALIVVSEEGENQIVVIPAANAALTPADVAAAEDTIAAADVMLLQFEVPMDTVEEAAAIADRYDTTVVLNPAPAAKLSAELLSHVDVLAPNETEAALLSSGSAGQPALDAARRLQAMGPTVVVVTLGARGAAICENGEARLEPPYLVANVVDTTAAGDAFLGALATALGEGRSTSAALELAMAAGALSVTRDGAQPSLPRRAEVEHLIAMQVRAPATP